MKRLWTVSVMVLAAVAGCDSRRPGGSLPVDKTPSPAAQHEHAEEGPHHGALVELGNEAYHAEVVHNADSVTVYILDSQAKNAVPIDVAEVLINASHEGKPQQFKLAASPEPGDGEGKASKFTSTDAKLTACIDDASAAPKLSVTIDGKPFRGEIKHAHHHP